MLKRTLRTVVPIAALAAIGGCTAAAPPAPKLLWMSSTAPAESCVPLGPVPGNARCDCYDKMSYDQVSNQATHELARRAREQYPHSDRVEVSTVELYLNNAIAHGIAYRCVATAQAPSINS